MDLEQLRQVLRMAVGGKECAEIRSYVQRKFGHRALKKTPVYKWNALARCEEEDQKIPEDRTDYPMR
jgi:hypothetical protein